MIQCCLCPLNSKQTKTAHIYCLAIENYGCMQHCSTCNEGAILQTLLLTGTSSQQPEDLLAASVYYRICDFKPHRQRSGHPSQQARQRELAYKYVLYCGRGRKNLSLTRRNEAHTQRYPSASNTVCDGDERS